MCTDPSSQQAAATAATTSNSGGGGGGGGASKGGRMLTWIVVIALIGVSAALAVTCTQLNEQITKERKLHEEEIQKLEEDLSSLRTDITVSATERLEALTKTSTLQRDLVAQKEECKANLKTQLTEMEATNHRLRTELKDQEKAAEETKERAESLEEKLKAKEEEQEKAQEKIAQLEEELPLMSSKLEETNTLVAKHEKMEEELQEMVEKLTSDVNTKNEKVNELERVIDIIRKEYKEKDIDYADCIVAERVCQDGNKKIREIAMEISEGKRKVDEQLLSYHIKIQDLEKMQEESRQQMTIKTSLLEAAQASAKALEERISELVAAQSEDEKNKSDLASEVSRLETLTGNLEARLQASDEASATEKARLNEQLQKNLEKLEEKEGALKKLMVIVRDKESKIIELQAQAAKTASKPKQQQPAAGEKKQGR